MAEVTEPQENAMDVLKKAIAAQGKYDVAEVEERARAVAESGVLEGPEPAWPRQETIAPSPQTPGVDEYGIPLTLDDLAETPNIHGVEARSTDPIESHLSAAAVEEREGGTGSFTPGAQKHQVLRSYASAEHPLTDTQAWERAGLHHRQTGWKRSTDLLDAKAIHHIDTVKDEQTGSQVRRCAITTVGSAILKKLDKGEKVEL